MYNDGIRKYQETMVHTMGPERMIVMLYEGVVRHLQGARADMAKDDVAGKATHLQKAQNIIAELNHSLDHKCNGEVAAGLSSIYNFIINELINAQVSSDVKHIDDVLRVLAPLLLAWQSIQPGTAENARNAENATSAGSGPETAPPRLQTEYADGDAIAEADKTSDLCVAV